MPVVTADTHSLPIPELSRYQYSVPGLTERLAGGLTHSPTASAQPGTPSVPVFRSGRAGTRRAGSGGAWPRRPATCFRPRPAPRPRPRPARGPAPRPHEATPRSRPQGPGRVRGTRLLGEFTENRVRGDGAFQSIARLGVWSTPCPVAQSCEKIVSPCAERTEPAPRRALRGSVKSEKRRGGKGS